MNRNKIEIMAKILEAALDGVNKTRIMYLAFLSSTQLKECLAYLQEGGMITAENRGRQIYKTTQRGVRYLQKYRELDGLGLQKTPKKKTRNLQPAS